MRFSYAEAMCDPSYYVHLAKAAEEAGYDSMTVPDSICYPEHSDAKYPYNGTGERQFLEDKPIIEPFTLIPALGAVTSRIRFATYVVKLPIRSPVLVAKSVTSVAVMTNDRFSFGVGTSPWPEDFQVCFQDWKTRGKRMDEMIEIIRGLMSGDYFGYEGQIFQMAPIKLCPVPTKPVPILIGGHTDIALKRAARIGDGWVAAGASLDDLAGYVKTLRTLRAEYGREKTPFEVHGMGAEAFSADGIKRLEDIGVDEVIIAFRNVYNKDPDTSLEEKLGQMRWYADNVIAKTR